MHIKKNNWNTNSISALVKMHARHLRIWLYLHQHKLPSENKAQLISGSSDLPGWKWIFNRFCCQRDYAGIWSSHSGLLWRCLLLASRQERWGAFSTDSEELSQVEDPGGAEGTSNQETSQHWALLKIDLRLPSPSAPWPGLPPLFKLFPLTSQ